MGTTWHFFGRVSDDPRRTVLHVYESWVGFPPIHIHWIYCCFLGDRVLSSMEPKAFESKLFSTFITRTFALLSHTVYSVTESTQSHSLLSFHRLINTQFNNLLNFTVYSVTQTVYVSMYVSV